ncbi:sulfonate transport system permease protein [Plantibacter flavus]|uniref:Sulfonate transport system permease protein n=1 Tax=Plantibacter flavus TaxID=150123 RepID=A0A3N2BZE0_9MICO|nr:ABC transporter permease [Plantibacter flavus]ROR80592.1 sulfonate transport system permease protein [Plantibacter flavus]SMG33036.1 sulfonate transport system permease protein [Plantibacter flavus]
MSDQPGLGTPTAGLAGAQATQSGREARAVLGSRRIVVVLGGFLVPVVILGAWQLVTAFGLVPPSQLPAPAEVWAAGVDLAQRGWLQQDVAISVQRVLIGFLIGAVLGLVLGAVVGLSRLGDILLSTTFAAIRAVPSLAWVPLLILWLKIGEESKITLIAIGAFFPVYTTVSAALRHVDKHLVEAGRAFGLNGVALFRTVQLPAVTPSVVSGLRLALAQSWLFLVAAELIASSMGLGFRLVDSQNNGRVDRIFFVIIVLALLGAITDALVGVLDRWIKRRWG